MNHPVHQIICATVCAACLLQPVSAELYRWVDENGVTQFTDRPPPDDIPVETLEVRTRGADPAAIKELEASLNRADEMRENRQEAAEKRRLAEEEQAVKAENCKRARSRLASYSIPNALIARQDGSRIRVDEPTRQRELAASREMIEKYCN